MAKIKNISGQDRTVPHLGGRLVLAGQVVDVDDEDAAAFLVQTEVWADPDAKPAPAKTAAAPRKRTAKKAAKKAAPAASETPAQDAAAGNTETAPAESGD